MVEVAAPDPAPRFEILGELRAWQGDRQLDLGPGKQRAVLAVLLINANKPISTSQIVDAVWGDGPPENGTNVVQKYVVGLRRTLEPGRSPRAPGQLLTRTDAGYLLRVEPGRLDADVFDEQVRRARAMWKADQPDDAAHALRAALGRWRGEALAGLAGPLFDMTRERLAEGRAAALEMWAEIGIEAGRHGQLVPELVRLVAEFPLREQLRYLLILALYRSGRQAEALAAYREARRFLAEEFGVEPGAWLRELHRRILRSDPELLTASATAAPVTTAAAPDAAPPVPPPSAPPPSVSPPYVPASSVPARYPLALPLSGPPAVAVPADAAVAGRTRGRSRLLYGFLIALPIITIGFLGWMGVAYLAARRRSLALALSSAGYFALIVAYFAVITKEQALGTWAIIVGMPIWLLAVGAPAVHVAVLGPDHSAGGSARTLDAAAVGALEQRVRREQARQLLAQHPVAARNLHLGRPDLTRQFDDGGLVDINGVPEYVLAALPGVGPQRAQLIVADRHLRGAFASVDDLVTRGLMPAPLVHSLRDELIAIH